MITVREARPEDYDAWSDFLKQADDGNPWQSIGWYNSIKHHPRIQPFLLIAEKNNKIVGGVVGCIGQGKSISKFFKLVKVTHGPVLEDAQFRDEVLREINKALIGKARALGAFLVDVKTQFLWGSDIFSATGYKEEVYGTPCSVIINLTDGEDKILGGMKKSARYRIRKAQEADITIEQVKTDEQIAEYYDLYIKTINRTGAVLIYPKSFFESLVREAQISVFFIAKYKGSPIAGTASLLWNKRVWAWNGVSLKEYWNLHVNRLLEWHAMQWGIKNEYNVYEIYGLPEKQKEILDGRDWYTYKTSFGGKIIRSCRSYTAIVSPLRWRLWSTLWQLRAKSTLLRKISDYMK